MVFFFSKDKFGISFLIHFQGEFFVCLEKCFYVKMLTFSN